MGRKQFETHREQSCHGQCEEDHGHCHTYWKNGHAITKPGVERNRISEWSKWQSVDGNTEPGYHVAREDQRVDMQVRSRVQRRRFRCGRCYPHKRDCPGKDKTGTKCDIFGHIEMECNSKSKMWTADEYATLCNVWWDTK